MWLWQMLHQPNKQISRSTLRSTNITWPKVCLKNLKKLKLAKHAYEEGHKIHWKDMKVLQIEPDTTYRKQRNMPICLWWFIWSVNPGWTSLPSERPLLHRSKKTTALSSVDYVWKLCFYVCTIQRICLFSDDFCSAGTLVLTTVHRHIVYGFFF
jgi:hypothetical protein